MALPHVSFVPAPAVLSAALQSLIAVLQSSVGVIDFWPAHAVEIVVQAAGGIAWSAWSAS